VLSALISGEVLLFPMSAIEAMTAIPAIICLIRVHRR
jgi:hypothetical protein